MKKKILILTLNDYIIYQPTILNLYDALVPYFDVEILSFKPYHATKKKDEERNITYLQPGMLGTQFYQKMDFILSKFTKYIRKVFPGYTYYYSYYNKYLPGILRKAARRYKGKTDAVIAVDLQTLALAQRLFGSVHFLSLEIDNNTNPYYKKIDISKIISVFVQSPMRYEYLFPGKDLTVFYIQNAPSYDGKVYPLGKRTDFVWAGAIDKRLAVIECIEFFKKYSDHKLVLKGGANKKVLKQIRSQYSDLIEQGTITINQDYLKSESFISFLSKFRMGFCFYDWNLIRESFNYQTAPSGKLFMYMASGTPVIACDIPGFKLISDFHAGVLIDDYEPATILKAVMEIESNYQHFSEGCYAAAEHFSFSRNVIPYIEFLRLELGA